MNIGEANATMSVLQFLNGDIDHCDEATRARIARDLLWLQERARVPLLGAGPRLDEAGWDAALRRVTFEAEAAEVPA